MMSLSVLPTELRQMIIEEVLTTPLPPPRVPSDVPVQNWFYPIDECTRRYAPDADYPAIAFNKQAPWGTQYLPLLLISKAIATDTKDVLRRVGRHITSTLDVMIEDDGDFKASWLMMTPATPHTERLDISIRPLRCMEGFGLVGHDNCKQKYPSPSLGELIRCDPQYI